MSKGNRNEDVRAWKQRYAQLLGAALLEARQPGALSLLDAARTLGTIPEAVAHYEAGVIWMPVVHLAQLARLYGVPARDLLPD